jgi:two-component system, OmpR family, sensor histidine kinase ChvG
VLDRTTQVLQAAAETVRPGAAFRRARRMLGHRRAAALLGVWRKRAAAATVVAAERIRDFFRASWRVLRTEGLLGVVRHSWQFFVTQGFSSLTRRIVFLNVFGLLALVVTIVPLNQVRAGLIEASVRSLLVQGEMIAGAIASADARDNDSTITIDPYAGPNAPAGDMYGSPDEFAFEFSIDPVKVAPLLRRIVVPTNTRARVYGSDGSFILDSRDVKLRGDVQQSDLPSPSTENQGALERLYAATRRWFSGGDLPRYYDLGTENGRGYPEVVQALSGQNASFVRADDRGRAIVSVAVPV